MTKKQVLHYAWLIAKWIVVWSIHCLVMACELLIIVVMLCVKSQQTHQKTAKKKPAKVYTRYRTNKAGTVQEHCVDLIGHHYYRVVRKQYIKNGCFYGVIDYRKKRHDVILNESLNAWFFV